MERRQQLQINLERVRERIERAAAAAHRDVATVRLVAVTKQVSLTVARELVELGVTDLGESRPQELWRKQAELPSEVCWHLIGPLQRNKARRTLPMVHTIHSVDSLTLLVRLDELSTELNVAPRILLEVNVSGEEAKHGFTPTEMQEVVRTASTLKRLKVVGLMTMAPYGVSVDSARSVFAALRTLRDQLQRTAPANCALHELSMGMSGDFEPAIAEGATLVRIGTALFENIDGAPT